MTQPTARRVPTREGGAGNPVPMSKRVRFRGQKFAPWMLLLPAILMVAVALGYPLVRQTIMSFQHFGLAQQFGQPAEWAGLSNYTAILSDSYFWAVFIKSVLFCIWTAGWTMIIGVTFAVLMLRLNLAVRTFLNTTLIVVWAMPALASLTVWQWLVDPRSGLLNYVLTSLGFESFKNFNWLGENYWTFYLVASAVIIWASLPSSRSPCTRRSRRCRRTSSRPPRSMGHRTSSRSSGSCCRSSARWSPSSGCCR